MSDKKFEDLFEECMKNEAVKELFSGFCKEGEFEKTVRVKMYPSADGNLEVKKVSLKYERKETDGMTLEELEAYCQELEEQYDDLEDNEPEDEDSDEYDDWEDELLDLEDEIDEVKEMIEELSEFEEE